jgi:hypothetical protein
MARVTVEAQEKFVSNRYDRYDTVSSHHMEWRYNVGPWVNLTEDKARRTLSIWGFDDKEITHMLHFARAFESLEFDTYDATCHRK